MNVLDPADIAWRGMAEASAGERGRSRTAAWRLHSRRCRCLYRWWGLLGLWTSILLKESNPDLDVVLLEKDICGGGPSGRNSGMLLSAWTKFSAIAALRGEADALQVVKQTAETIDLIEAHCRADGIDCWLDRVGWVWGATCEAPERRVERRPEQAEPARLRARATCDADEIAAMSGSTGFLAGAHDASAATVHPGHLVRGLRRSALKRGVRLYEKTPMVRFSRTREPTVETPQGRVKCVQSWCWR